MKQHALTATSDTTKYIKSSSSSSGEDKICGELRYCFNSIKVFSCSGPYKDEVFFLMLLKKGLHLFEILEINLLRVAIFPVNICTSLTDFGVSKVEMDSSYVGLASIPHLVTMFPKNYLEDTPNAHFAGFNRIL